MGTSETQEMLALAERFFAAVCAGDEATLRAIYAPDAAVWHNYDGIEQNVEQNLLVLRWVSEHIEGFRYEGRVTQATAAGFVEQHRTRGRTASGFELDMPACIVCTVVDGRITRVDEYLDSAQIAPLLA